MSAGRRELIVLGLVVVAVSHVRRLAQQAIVVIVVVVVAVVVVVVVVEYGRGDERSSGGGGHDDGVACCVLASGGDESACLVEVAGDVVAVLALSARLARLVAQYEVALLVAVQVGAHDFGEEAEEDELDEARYGLAAVAHVVYVEREDGHGRAERDDARGGQVEDGYERQLFARRRHRLRRQYEKHCQAEQRRDADAHLLGTRRRQVEAQEGHQRDEQARKDHVEDVEERTATNHQLVLYFRVGLLAAREDLHDLLGRQIDQMPLAVFDVVREIALARVHVQIEQEAVIGPTGEYHVARLLVERKVLDVYCARALEDDRRQPRHIAIVLHYGVCRDARDLRPVISVVAFLNDHVLIKLKMMN